MMDLIYPLPLEDSDIKINLFFCKFSKMETFIKSQKVIAAMLQICDLD